MVCPPFGYEYTHSHRSVRHLCDQLALAGVDAVRFDFQGCGDSSGSDYESGRLEQWKQDIASAVQYAKQITGATRVCLVGIRLGALLAALASASVPVDYLVLWNPVVNGRRYLRELKAAAATTMDNAAEDAEGYLESGGFLMSMETTAALQGINLLDLPVSVQRRVLLVWRDDIGSGDELLNALTARGTAVDQLALPGYADMMARLELNVVPSQSIRALVDWVCCQFEPAGDVVGRHVLTEWDKTMPVHHEGTDLMERICQFGDEQELFGIMTTPGEGSLATGTVLLLNSGSVHHVGPGRLYVNLARELARNGLNCIRVDIEGIGDSVLRAPGRENHPYPDHAFQNVTSVIRNLKQDYGLKRFALAGLCSGAYTAFHVAVNNSDDESILHVLSINPLTFKWIEGETLLLTQQFKQEQWELSHYRSSARDWRRWLKLLTGKVDYRFIFSMVVTQLAGRVRALYRHIRERFQREPATELGRQLKQLLLNGRSLTFVIASGDPGYELLLRDGGFYVRQLMKKHRIVIKFVPDADHTFSRLNARLHATDIIRDDLLQAFGRSAR